MQYKLRDMSWSEFAQRSKTAKTIILPSGACEVYGPHTGCEEDVRNAGGAYRRYRRPMP